MFSQYNWCVRGQRNRKLYTVEITLSGSALKILKMFSMTVPQHTLRCD